MFDTINNMNRVTNFTETLTRRASSFEGIGENVEFVNLVSTYTTALLSAVILGLILKVGTVFIKFNRSNGVGGDIQKSSIKHLPLVSVLKHFIQNRLDLPHSCRSLISSYGTAWKFNVFGKEYVVLHDATMLQKLYMSWEPGHVQKPSMYSKMLVGPLANGLTSSRANVWKLHRNAISKSFSYNSLRKQVKIFDEHAQKMVKILNKAFISAGTDATDHSGKNSILDQVIHDTTFKVITEIAAGKHVVLDQTDVTLFNNTFHRSELLMSYRSYHPWLFPDWIWYLHPKRRELDRAINTLENIVHKIQKMSQEGIHPKEDNQSDGIGITPLVAEMVKSGYTDKEIFPELFTFLIFGPGTVSMTLNLTLFYLAINPEFQKNCRDEVDQMFEQMEADDRSDIPMESLSELNFLDRCIKEELRLYPTTPVIGRELESPISIDDRTTVKPGAVVITSLWHLHRNPENFRELEQFIPDRFLPENSTNRKVCAYMPFATGPRNCIGGKSAMLEIKILAAYILRNFEMYTNKTLENVTNEFEKCIWPPPELDVCLRRRNY